MGGELFDMVIERKYFSEADAASITAAILSVIQHCHSKGIIHRGAQRASLSDGSARLPLRSLGKVVHSAWLPKEAVCRIRWGLEAASQSACIPAAAAV